MNNTEASPAAIRMSAMNFLAMREHSSKELYTKLSKKFGHEDIITSVLLKLQTEGLQNDQRFADAFTAMRIRQGKGKIIIKLELKEKGISAEIISTCMAKNTDWDDYALNAYVKKFGWTDSRDIKEKSKRIRFLASRGFSQSNIQYALNHSLNSSKR